MASRNNIEIGEWYHCYNRGVDKRDIFGGETDAERFLMLLYLSNDSRPVALYNTHKPELSKVLQAGRDGHIVSLGAYCLMPNHFHLLIKEVTEGGITSFMRKIGTAYTMYFNKKYERVGHLFCGQFRSRHVGTDEYFQRVLPYIHCNPAELYEPKWKKGMVRNRNTLAARLIEYPYSSLHSYVDRKKTNPILSIDGFEIARMASIPKMLQDAQEYYSEIARGRFER